MRDNSGQVSTSRPATRQSHLDWLEAESIYILREVVAECARPALLFSGGKDSSVVLHLACKAFNLGAARRMVLPFPLVHIDTGHNFAEVIEFRDRCIRDMNAELIVGHVEASIARGTVRLRRPSDSRNAAQAITLLETIAEHGFDALIGGARRDEEKARAKERIFSLRDEFGQWDPKAQRPELWDLYDTALHAGEHLRVFPISNWTELDIWQYIARERIALPSLYYAHRRPVVRRAELLVPVTPLTPLREGERAEELIVRFRTVGDISCTCPVESRAADAAAVVKETAGARLSERGATRMDDLTSETAMERRKKQGYF